MTKIFTVAIIIAAISGGVCYAQDNASTAPKVIENEKLIDTRALLNELKDKEKALNVREADLNAREQRLKTIESDIIAREGDLKKMRKEVTDRLAELQQVENVELDKLAKIYASSKPKAAAAIFVKMDVDKSVSIFRRMTPSAAGKILNEMGRLDPTYASKVSEGLTPQPIFSEQP